MVTSRRSTTHPQRRAALYLSGRRESGETKEIVEKDQESAVPDGSKVKEERARIMDTNLSRRRLLQAGATMGAAGLAGIGSAETLFLAAQGTPQLTPNEIAEIDEGIGKRGNYNDTQNTHVVQFPRNDLKVTIKGEPVPTALGFAGWAAFRRTMDGESVILMSDNVVLPEEVNPLIDAALDNGLQVGSIRGHFFFEEPRIVSVHLHGMGTPGALARRYAKTIADTKIAPGNQPRAGGGGQGQKTARDFFNVASLDKIVGKPGAVNGPALKYTIARSDLRVRELGAELTAAIGLNTWCAIVGTSAAALAAGDVAMLAHEVNPVIKLLRAAGFEICALQNHMLTEQPRILYLHFLGRGPAEDLARTFRGVLDLLGPAKPR